MLTQLDQAPLFQPRRIPHTGQIANPMNPTSNPGVPTLEPLLFNRNDNAS